MEARSPTLQEDSLPSEPPVKPSPLDDVHIKSWQDLKVSLARVSSWVNKLKGSNGGDQTSQS